MFLRHLQCPVCEPGLPAPRLTQGLLHLHQHEPKHSPWSDVPVTLPHSSASVGIVTWKVLVGWNSLHFVSPWEMAAVSISSPLSRRKGSATEPAGGGLAVTRGLSDLPSPGSLLSQGLAAQPLPQVCTVLTP